MFDGIRRTAALALWRGAVKAGGIEMLPGWVKDPLRDFTIQTVVQHGYMNSAVYACVRVLAESFPEPELHVYDETPEGETVILADHPLRQLLRRPNPYMAEDEFWEFCITYAALGGNFYIWKERNNAGQVVALWPMHDGQLRPRLHPTEWITGYVLEVSGSNGGRSEIVIPPSEVIHWRWSIDPRQPQVGLAPIIAASRPVDMDSEYLRYQHALAHNDAVPRTIVKTRMALTDDKMRQLKEQMAARFGGDKRGDVAFVNDPDVEIMRLGANLQELAVEAIHNIPESRIAAVYGGAPVGFLAGLNVHLQRSTFSNYEAAELALHRRVLMAKWRSVEGCITNGLRWDFQLPPTMSIRFDTSRVAALAGERQAKEAHALTMFVAGLWGRNEARAATGQRPLLEDVIMEPANALPSPVVYLEDQQAADATAAVVAVAGQIEEAASPTVSLNGAQIASLIQLIQSIGNGPGQLPRSTVVELIVTSFSMDRGRVEEILSAIPASGLGSPEATAKARPARSRVDVSAVRQGLQARRILSAEYEKLIADALEEERQAAIDAISN